VALKGLAEDRGVRRPELERFLRTYASDFGASFLLRNLITGAGFRLPAAVNTLEYTFTKRLALSAIEGCVGEGQKVLSVGFGDGLLEVNLARRGCLVWGLEVDRNLAWIATRLARDAGLEAQCNFRAHRKRTYPFRTAFFDVVLFSHSLHQVKDAKGALRECHRVLRPGGEVLVLEDAAEMRRLTKLVDPRRFTVAERRRLFPARSDLRGLVQPVTLLRLTKIAKS
jgi:SAM-dependent methyltransferase